MRAIKRAYRTRKAARLLLETQDNEKKNIRPTLTIFGGWQVSPTLSRQSIIIVLLKILFDFLRWHMGKRMLSYT